MTFASALGLAGIGAVASGINAVAGGGSLISYPVLTLGFRIPDLTSNATNSVALWPGSLASAFGLLNLLKKSGHHLRALFVPTLLGSALGAWLLVHTSQTLFQDVIPWLILLAAVLLFFQPKIRGFVNREHRKLPAWLGLVLQFLVSLYGGYFGAGMGIMMLASFALYMEGTIHELNAVKNWLGLLINLAASVLFIAKGMVLLDVAAALTVGSVLGGFLSARVSQRFDPERLRLVIACYGLGMSALFFYRAYWG